MQLTDDDTSRQRSKAISTFFAIGIAALILLPSISIAPHYSTFIHPSRPELLIGIFVFLLSVWQVLRGTALIPAIGRRELVLLVGPVALFVLWSAASALWAQSVPSVAHHTGLWLCYLATYVFARTLFANEYSTDTLVVSISLAIVVLAVPLIIEYHWTMMLGESPSLGIRYSRFTELFNTAVPLVAALFLRSKGRSAWLAYGTVVITALANVASLSRTGTGVFFLLLIGLTAACFIFTRLRRFKLRMLALFAGVLLAIGASAAFTALVASELPIAKRLSDPASTLSSYVRPFFGSIAIKMWSENPMLGVGADNFGQEMNRYRRAYAVENPQDPLLVIGEAEIAERAHNEYLQILAELGIVGAVLFSLFLTGIVWCGIRITRSRSSIELMPVAAMFGVGAFLVSSLVTSYSFRLAPNGAIFFVVLAMAVSGAVPKGRPALSRLVMPLVTGVAIIGSAALIYVSVYRLYAIHFQLAGIANENIAEAEGLLAEAISIDPENANFYSNYGWKLLEKGRWAEAPAKFRAAIDAGRCTSIDYSALAGAHLLNNDPNAALLAIEEGVSIYPRSVFLRVRRAVLLKDLGRAEESQREFDLARSYDDGQARSWWNLIDSGGRIAAIRAHAEGIPDSMDLVPRTAVYQLVSERELRFPEEKFVIPQN